MPNGYDRNWIRMCGAIDGFRARYGAWPTKMRLYEGALDGLFTEATLVALQQRLTLIIDGSPFIAEDDAGRSYNYGKEGFSQTEPNIKASVWLGITPDLRPGFH